MIYLDNLHPIFKRQIKKCTFIKENISNKEVVEFLEAISSTYFDYDEEKALLERSIEISSREFLEHSEKIKKLQAQFIHNEKMAGIGQLSAGIVHEINNPLGFIQSNIDTLKKYMIKMQNMHEISKKLIDDQNQITLEEYRECCVAIKEFIRINKMGFVFKDIPEIMEETTSGISRIEKIVRSLLGFSRRSQESELAEYDLNKGILDTLTIVNNEIKYHSKTIVELQDIPIIMAFSGEINQVILNLLVNAAYAIKTKGESLENNFIKIKTYSDNTNVYCEIEDTGIGIAESIRDRIFDPFFTTKPVGSGTGLGLGIAHDIIVNKHKGNILVESSIGIGTKFTIVLPFRND